MEGDISRTITLNILDSVTDAGNPDRENEDRLGWNDSAAFVIDGATSLGDPVIDPHRSDAAWLADKAAQYFSSNLTSGSATSDVIRAFSSAVRKEFANVTRNADVERYRFPTAAFQTLRVAGSGIEVAGLGDCVLFLQQANGELLRWSAFRPKRSREQYFAGKALEQSGGFDSSGVGFRHENVLADLRSRRARQNVEGSPAWTLGLEPKAADHLATSVLSVELPATAVLCTDGFGDLVDAYGMLAADELLARAATNGLRSLVTDLRQIERVDDPDGVKFPRYKRSDDASALLIRLEDG